MVINSSSYEQVDAIILQLKLPVRKSGRLPAAIGPVALATHLRVYVPLQHPSLTRRLTPPGPSERLLASAALLPPPLQPLLSARFRPRTPSLPFDRRPLLGNDLARGVTDSFPMRGNKTPRSIRSRPRHPSHGQPASDPDHSWTPPSRCAAGTDSSPVAGSRRPAR